MQYIILIGDENLTLDAIKAIEHDESIGCHDVYEDRFCVKFNPDHIFYDYDQDISGYEKEDMEKIPYQNPHFITMVYRSEERMRKVLQQDNFLRGIYVDNDYNLIVPIEDFIERGMPVD